jgi:hypothetical protein
MPTGKFPFFGSVGYGTTREVTGEMVFIYKDGTYRRYQASTTIQKRYNCAVKNVSESVRDTITSFWESHKQATTQAGFEFYFYHPDIAAPSDYNADNGVGRFTGIFTDPNLEWTQSGRCRYSTNINIFIVA